MGCAPSGGHGSVSELAQVGLGQAHSDHSCLRVRNPSIEYQVVRRRPCFRATRRQSNQCPHSPISGCLPRLIEVLTKQSIIEPFPIQEATIPDLMAGRDVLGRAPTGSGKTLAFGLPLVAMVGKATSRRPRAMVLAPTRELAEQIARELRPFARVSGRAVAAVYGGVGYDPQRNALRKGADVRGRHSRPVGRSHR